jgi:hypothetical protein
MKRLKSLNSFLQSINNQLTFRVLAVSHVSESEDGGVDLRGQMISTEVGIYAVRITQKKNMKKDIKIVGPAKIEYDKSAKTFIVSVEGPLEDVFYSEDSKFLEIYTRKKPESIPYGQETNERLNVNHLELVYRMYMEYYPDPRAIIEDARDKEKEVRKVEDDKKKKEEELIIKEAEKLARKEERVKMRQLIKEAREAGEDLESLASSTLYSEKSHSKKSGALKTPGTGDQQSVTSPDGVKNISKINRKTWTKAEAFQKNKVFLNQQSLLTKMINQKEK